MPQKYQGLEVRIKQVDKINKRRDGIILYPGICCGDSKTVVSPILYLDGMYDEFVRTGDLQTTLQMAAECMNKEAERMATNFPETKDFYKDLEKDKVIFQLINTEKNKDMLEKLPHRDFLNLSVIYRLILGAEEEDVMASCVINFEMAKALEMEENDLFSLAIETSKRLLPPVICTLKEALIEGMPQEQAELIMQDAEEPPVWVLSNKEGIFGASSMLYAEDILYDLAESMGSDLYILPSSMHEVLAVPAILGNPEGLARMVRTVNAEEVYACDQLSDSVYYYDKNLRKIRVVI